MAEQASSTGLPWLYITAKVGLETKSKQTWYKDFLMKFLVENRNEKTKWNLTLSARNQAQHRCSWEQQLHFQPARVTTYIADLLSYILIGVTCKMIDSLIKILTIIIYYGNPCTSSVPCLISEFLIFTATIVNLPTSSISNPIIYTKQFFLKLFFKKVFQEPKGKNLSVSLI